MSHDLDGVHFVGLVNFLAKVDSAQGWDKVFQVAEIALLPENKHRLVKLSDSTLAKVLDALAINEVPDYGGLQTHLGPLPGFERLKDVLRVAFLGVLFSEVVKSEHYMPTLLRYIDGRIAEMWSVWRQGWIDEHGQPPPETKYEFLVQAKRVGFSTTDLKAGECRLWEVLGEIGGRLTDIRDQTDGLAKLRTWLETTSQSLPESSSDLVRDLARKLGGKQKGISVDLKKGTITVDGTAYETKAHWCTAVNALVEEGGRNLTGPELCKLHGCASKRWDREFKAMKEKIPAFRDRIVSDGRLGYRVIVF